jgi:hypothetical protein
LKKYPLSNIYYLKLQSIFSIWLISLIGNCTASLDAARFESLALYYAYVVEYVEVLVDPTVGRPRVIAGNLGRPMTVSYDDGRGNIMTKRFESLATYDELMQYAALQPTGQPYRTQSYTGVNTIYPNTETADKVAANWNFGGKFDWKKVFGIQIHISHNNSFSELARIFDKARLKALQNNLIGVDRDANGLVTGERAP